MGAGYVVFGIVCPLLGPLCMSDRDTYSSTGVMLHYFCVYICSQHEEKEQALKEQLSHLAALIPTLQVAHSQI